MKTDSFCCCSSLLLSIETTRFYLLFLIIAIYMLADAAIFSILERLAERQAHQLWERRLRDFSQEHNISCEDLKFLLRYYEEARTAGIWTERERSLWDIPGFGESAPSTRVLLIFNGMLGYFATMLFFSLFPERVITVWSLLIIWCHR